jgi:hypothetical protein
MNRALVFLAFAFLTSASTPAAEPWKEFTAKDNSFSILFPGEPAEKSAIQQTAVGPTKMTMYSVELKEGVEPHSALGVSISEYPVGAVGEEHTQTLLNSARDGAVKAFKGQLRGERDLELGGLKGKEVILETQTSVARMRYFWVPPRLYQINVITTPEMENTLSNDFEKFFASFKLNQQ